MMSKSVLGRPSLREAVIPMPSVSFLGGDVDLLDAAEDQELIMGNLVLSGAAVGAGNQVNDSDSALLMSEMENLDEEDARRPHSCQGDDHCHGPMPADDIKSRNQLIAVSCCCFFFMVAEIVGGLIANSLAIATDATHLACDLAGFLVSLFAIWISKKPPSKKMTFGYYRAEVVGALISVLLIWALTAVLVVMAIHRIQEKDYTIEGTPMLITASLGVFFNIVMGVVLHSGLCSSCNVQHGWGHGHSHGGSGHGHSHGGSGHGHSHGGSGHGHSHGGSGHGHSHAGSGHGHSHGGSGHGHSHNHGNSPTHGHSYVQGHASNHGVVGRPPRSIVMPADEAGDSTFTRHVEFDRAGASTTVAMCDFSAGVLDDGDAALYPTGTINGTIPGEARSRSLSSCFNVSNNLNVRAAFVHVVGDLIQSIGVFVAALIIIIKPEYKIADPICTFVFSALVLFTTLSVLKDVLIIILEGAPSGVNYQEVKNSLTNLPGVRTVHGLNIWSITVDKIALNVHLAVCNPQEDWDKVLKSATSMLRTRFNIFHPTIQVEPYDDQAMKHCTRCNHP